MMEPAYSHFPQEGYLQAVRRIADKHGALLIFDKMITAFRMHRGGAQTVYGVTPDLTTVGKSLANGMPLSALMGRKDVMEYVNIIFYGMTFQHDSVALAVSRACLQYYHTTAITTSPPTSIARARSSVRSSMRRQQWQAWVPPHDSNVRYNYSGNANDITRAPLPARRLRWAIREAITR